MHGWKVYTEHALRWQQSHMAPPMLPNRPDPASTSLLWTFQAYYVWGATLPTISHSESHATRAQWDCLEFQNCLSVLYKSNQTISVRLSGISEMSVSAIQKWSSNQCETAWNFRTVCQCYTKVIKQSMWDCLELQNCLSVLYKSDQSINQSIHREKRLPTNN